MLLCVRRVFFCEKCRMQRIIELDHGTFAYDDTLTLQALLAQCGQAVIDLALFFGTRYEGLDDLLRKEPLEMQQVYWIMYAFCVQQAEDTPIQASHVDAYI